MITWDHCYLHDCIWQKRIDASVKDIKPQNFYGLFKHLWKIFLGLFKHWSWWRIFVLELERNLLGFFVFILVNVVLFIEVAIWNFTTLVSMYIISKWKFCKDWDFFYINQSVLKLWPCSHTKQVPIFGYLYLFTFYLRSLFIELTNYGKLKLQRTLCQIIMSLPRWHFYTRLGCMCPKIQICRKIGHY